MNITKEDSSNGSKGPVTKPLYFPFTNPRFTKYSVELHRPGRHKDFTSKTVRPFLDGAFAAGVEHLYMLASCTGCEVLVPKTALTRTAKVFQDPNSATDPKRHIVVHFDPRVKAKGIYGLEKGDAFLGQTAGSTLAVVSLPDGIIIPFVGTRESWINRAMIVKEATKRTSLSILHDVVDILFHEYKLSPNEASFRAFFSLSAREFPHPVGHPEFSTYNDQLPAFCENHLPGVLAVPEHDGINHLDLGQVALGWANKLRFADTGVHRYITSSDRRGFVTSAADGRYTDRFNNALAYTT